MSAAKKKAEPPFDQHDEQFVRDIVWQELRSMGVSVGDGFWEKVRDVVRAELAAAGKSEQKAAPPPLHGNYKELQEEAKRQLAVEEWKKFYSYWGTDE